jgi:hypothetical protein
MKEENKKVYVVTHGSYSDYAIDAVFDNKTDADEYAAQINSDVEEWDLNPEFLYENGSRAYNVMINRDGDSEVRYGGYGTNRFSYRKGMELGKNDFIADFTIRCRGDEKHAVKIANERRLMLIASGDWDRILEECKRISPPYGISVEIPKVWEN